MFIKFPNQSFDPNELNDLRKKLCDNACDKRLCANIPNCLGCAFYSNDNFIKAIKDA